MFGFAAETSYNFLTKDLTGFAPNVALAMENINNGLQAFSYALLVILTLWNVVRTAGSYVELKRPEHVFKLFMRFILTKYSSPDCIFGLLPVPGDRLLRAGYL